MKPRTKQVFRGLLVCLALVVLAVLIGVVPIRINAFEGVIARSVFEATGLDLTIGGTTHLRLGPRGSLSANQLALSVPDGARLVEVEEARLRVSLLALLRRQLHVSEAEVVGLNVDYCRPLPEQPSEPAATDEPSLQVAIDDLKIVNVGLNCDGEPGGVSIERLAFAAPIEAATRLKVLAELAGVPATLKMSGGSLDTFLRGLPFAAEAELEVENASVAVDGEFTLDEQGPDMAARVDLVIPDPVALGEVFGLAFPPIGAIDVSGSVNGDIDSIDLTDLAGRAGNTQITAEGSLEFSAERPRATLHASLGTLDLAPFLGARLSPDDDATNLTPLLEALQQFDADLSVQADQVSGLPLDIRRAALDASLANGVVELDALHAELLDGWLVATGTLDTRPDCPPLRLEVAFESPDLAVWQDAGLLDLPISGQVERIEADAESCGAYLAAHVDRLAATLTASNGNLVIGKDLPVDVASLQIDIAPGARTRATARASVDGAGIRASVSAGTLPAMLGASPWPLRLDVTAADSTLTVDGTFAERADGFRFDGRSTLNVPTLSSLSEWLGVAESADAALVATSRVTFGASHIAAEDLHIELGSSDLAGSASWLYAETPGTLALKLHSNFVDLDELGGMFEIAPAAGRRTAKPSPYRSAAARLPPVDLEMFVDVISDGPVDIEDLAINGRMRAGFIDDARVSAIVEDELNVTGKLDFDARELPAALEMDVAADGANLGRVLGKLEMVEDLAMRAESIRIRVESTGASLGETLANASMRADAQNFEWDIPRPQSDAEFELRLPTVALSMQTGRSLIASTSGTIEETPVELFVEVPGLGALVGDAETLPLRLVAGLGTDVAFIDAEIGRLTDEVFSARFELSGQAIEPGGPGLSEIAPPLADYALSGELEFDGKLLSVANLEARLGGSTASGNASLSLDARPRVVMDIESPRLQATDLVLLPGFVRNDADPAASTSAPPGQEIIESKVETRAPLVLVNDLIVRYQERYDFDLRVVIDELYAGQDLVGGAEANLYIDEREFRLRPVRIRLPGGGLTAEYAWRLDGGRMAAELSAQANGLVYGGLLRLVDPEYDGQGVAYIDVDFDANADWAADVPEFELLLANANGTVDIAAWPENFETGLLDLWTANLIFALLPTPIEGEPSRLNCVAARLKADDGLLETKNVLLDSTGTIIRGRGKIDLSQRNINLLVTPQAKRERFFSASTPVRVTGPLNDFQVGVEPAGFIGTVFRWYISLIYVPFKWLTGQRFPPDGIQTCFDVMDWELTPSLETYFLERDFSVPPPTE